MNAIAKFCGAVLVLLLLGSALAAASAGEIKGKVKSVDPDRLEFVLDDNSGKMTTFQMDEDAQVIINNQDATLMDLREGDVVSVIHRQDGTAWMAIEVRCKRK
jgi:Cu/Ag efflux protein CusF